MPQTIRSILLIEAFTFFLAGLVHSGVLIDGYQHRQAAIAESLIGLVLLGGLILSWVRPSLASMSGLVAQSIALLGTLIGAFTIAIGVGPRSVPDIVYHVGILVVLCSGLLFVTRTRDDRTTQHA